MEHDEIIEDIVNRLYERHENDKIKAYISLIITTLMQ